MPCLYIHKTFRYIYQSFCFFISYMYWTYNSHNTMHLYNDASVHCFSNEHLPFAILAIFILFTFILIPALFLCLYPNSSVPEVSWLQQNQVDAIHAFAEAFIGCYKDGTKTIATLAGSIYLLFHFGCVLAQGKYSWTILISIAIYLQSLCFSFSNHTRITVWFNILDSLWLVLITMAALASTYRDFVAEGIPTPMLQLIVTLPLLYFTLYAAHQNTHKHPTNDMH